MRTAQPEEEGATQEIIVLQKQLERMKTERPPKPAFKRHPVKKQEGPWTVAPVVGIHRNHIYWWSPSWGLIE